jgi:hypothetical protein
MNSTQRSLFWYKLKLNTVRNEWQTKMLQDTKQLICINFNGIRRCSINLSEPLCLISDINECAQTPGICQNGACENLIATYRCICNPGYQVDNTGKICSDINECELDDLVCSGGQCRNTPGSFQVSECFQWYSPVELFDNVTCTPWSRRCLVACKP